MNFLKERKPLALQVAEFLLKDAGNDLSRVEVWIPTAGAGRRIRRSLAERGVLSPKFVQPMRALLPTGNVRLVERFEREAAWAQVLDRAEDDLREVLFSSARRDSQEALLKSAGVLCDLCDLLAEAGGNPASRRVAEVCDDDSDRWDALAELHRRQIAELKHHGLTDPNEARLAEMESPTRAGGIDRLVIACIPDLPIAAQCFAEALKSRGVRIEVLVWMPGESSGGFDSWGRPIAAEWADCRLDIEDSRILMARSPELEARAALDFALSSKTPGDYALVLADPKISDAFRSEVENRGGRAFLPEGGRLDLSEPGIIALEWERFRITGELRILRRLLELPRFSRVFREGSVLKTEDALAACDYLIGEAVLTDLGQAEEFATVEFTPEEDKKTLRARSRIFVERAKTLLRNSASEILHAAWVKGGAGLEDARKVVELHEKVANSTVCRNLSATFSRVLKSEPVFETSTPGDVELSGWLEAPWCGAERLSLSGCVEGVIPSSVNGHAFLPDSKRRALGLADNAARFARDAYLLECLLKSRPAEDFRCSFSRFDGAGSPLLPSSLFLRCAEESLPGRVRELFGEISMGSVRARRENSWRWSLPEAMRKKVVKISPTDFAEYLACPFRYYLKRVLYLDEFTPDAREMDAKRFGSLVHEALENFGRQTPDESDPEQIERLVFEHLDSAARKMFGPAPSPAVRIQIEGARARLRGFARVQAAQFAEGWRIMATEEKLESDAENPLTIGPLKLSAKIDRVERNEKTCAWRVLDYKTHAKSTAPARKHLGSPLSVEWLPEAAATLMIGDKEKKKRWAELQLPLYRKILRHLRGSQIGEATISTGYFTLSADPADAAVVEFGELDEALMGSAMTCAEAVAARVFKGNFWPPQTPVQSWDDPFERFFLNGKPESCVAEETIEFLKGAA